MRKILLPVRIDFIGGWSDQTDWTYPAAVVNASIGWSDGFDGHYPLYIDGESIDSKIQGIGTGLGVSSIIAAGKFLASREEDEREGYIQAVLDWERSNGTKGGWQDQIGSIEGGLKLIKSKDHRSFDIKRRDDHPVLDHVVIFDTMIRRPSRSIGDKMRVMFGKPDFDRTLRKIVNMAEIHFMADAETFSLACIEAWRLLNSHVNADIECVPCSELIWGYKLVGAGGGGYGIAFVKIPEERREVCQLFESKGMWATIPILLDGIKKK